VISGHTDTVGSEAYNDQLSTERAAAVAAAIRNDPRFRDALSLVDFGERKLAVATEDEVAESMNRRVEIQVMVPEE
jgi:OOP family OmpA-OmpF porin